MRNVIKKVLDQHGVHDLQESIIEELTYKLTEAGYVHIDMVKLDPERVVLCVSKIMNELQKEKPLIVEG